MHEGWRYIRVLSEAACSVVEELTRWCHEDQVKVLGIALSLLANVLEVLDVPTSVEIPRAEKIGPSLYYYSKRLGGL